MYEPPHFVEDRREVLHGLIQSSPLGLLVSNGAEGPIADAVPFALHPGVGRFGTLRAHVARSNAHWQRLAANPDEPILVVFQGPQAYVTPSWYATKQETGKVVPTWNYVIVQVRGKAVVHPEADWLRAQVADLTDRHEAEMPQPWAMTDAPAPYVEQQLRAIVGIEIVIADIRGKWKVSQNRPAADRLGVAEGMDLSAREQDRQMAKLVRERNQVKG
jgi:transcriptional regulator